MTLSTDKCYNSVGSFVSTKTQVMYLKSAGCSYLWVILEVLETDKKF